jgi:hypothetical protein
MPGRGIYFAVRIVLIKADAQWPLSGMLEMQSYVASWDNPAFHMRPV